MKIHGSWEKSDGLISIWDESYERELNVNESWVSCQQDGIRRVGVNLVTLKHSTDVKASLWRAWECTRRRWDRFK